MSIEQVYDQLCPHGIIYVGHTMLICNDGCHQLADFPNTWYTSWREFEDGDIDFEHHTGYVLTEV